MKYSMKYWLVSVLTIILLATNLTSALAEDETEVFSTSVEETVMESDNIDLPEDGEVTFTEVAANPVIDETIGGSVIQEEPTSDMPTVDDDKSEDEPSDGVVIEGIEDNNISSIDVSGNASESDEPQEQNNNSEDAIQQNQTMLEVSTTYDEFTQSADDVEMEEVETELATDDSDVSSDGTLFYEAGDNSISAENIGYNSESEDTKSMFPLGLMAAEASISLQRPSDVDNGYWVNVYRNYMDNVSKYKGYAILVDFDLDGIPELLAIDETWSHSGMACCYVKYTGSDYIVYEGSYLYDLEADLYLTFENGSYVWYKSRSYANTGLYDKSINKLTFNSDMKPTEDIWFGLYGDADKGTEGYQIGSRTVSRNDYDQEVAKWNNMNKLLQIDPCVYNYPSNWNNAVNLYSVIKTNSNGTNIGNSSTNTGNNTGNTGSSTGNATTNTISVPKNTKRTVSVGTIYQIDLNGKTGKKYRSSKKKVATVSSTGLITPKSAGKTRITFKVGKKRRTLTLTVKDPTIPTSVSLNMSGTNTVNQGDIVTLTATLPAGTSSGIKWKSNHKSIATVSNGVVRFKKKGTVTITATTTRGKKKAKVIFKVTKYDSKKDLANYGWRTVTGVTGDNKLTFRQTHTGGYMSNHRFANGEQIYVNLTWREGGDAIAYDNGTYGYVQAKYIAW